MVHHHGPGSPVVLTKHAVMNRCRLDPPIAWTYMRERVFTGRAEAAAEMVAHVDEVADCPGVRLLVLVSGFHVEGKPGVFMPIGGFPAYCAQMSEWRERLWVLFR